MTDWSGLRKQAELYKATFPAGTRIVLLKMGDDPRPIQDNTRGTVDMVDDIGTIHCTFDDGRRLGIIPGEDRFRKLTAAELVEESQKTNLDDLVQNAESKADVKKSESSLNINDHAPGR